MKDTNLRFKRPSEFQQGISEERCIQSCCNQTAEGLQAAPEPERVLTLKTRTYSSWLNRHTEAVEASEGDNGPHVLSAKKEE